MKKLKLLFSAFIITCFSLIVFSCNNSGVSPTNYSRLQIINVLAGSSPINFTVNAVKKNTNTIAFPAASGYISVSPGSSYIQFQTATTGLNLATVDTAAQHTNLIRDSSYSVFLTGTTSDFNLLRVWDNLSSPTVGRAKIRFINTSTNSGGLDVTINGTNAYTNILYKGVGSYIEVPAGTYEFRANKTGTVSTLSTLSNQVLADGKIYTLYTAGLVGSTATNAAFGLSMIANLLPATK